MKRLLFALGFVALTGSAFAQNWSKELEKTAKQGDAIAQYEVGICYLEGKGVAQDYKKAAQWLVKSMNQGNEDARAKFHSFWSKELEKTAKQGDAIAQYEVGICYLEGKGTAQNYPKAAQWLVKSMNQGNEDARAKFYSFWSKELENMGIIGDTEAQYRLGLAYLNGAGVAVDKEAAAEWLYKAKNNGHKEARDKYYSFESKTRADRTTIYKTEVFPVGLRNAELTCELNHETFVTSWGDSRTTTTLVENSYIKIVTETDTITGFFVQDDILVDATFKHGDEWVFRGNIRTDIAERLPIMLKPNVDLRSFSPFEYTLLASGFLDYKNSYIDPNYNLPVLCSQVNFRGRLKSDVYVDGDSYELGFPRDFEFSCVDEFLIPLNSWQGLFPDDTYFGDFMNAKYGSYAYGKTSARIKPGREAEALEYSWTLPNGGRIEYLNGYKDDVYYLPGSSEPLDPLARRGTITSGNNVQLTWDLGEETNVAYRSWNYSAGASNPKENPYKLKVVTDKGVIIDVTSSRKWDFLYETILYSIANGAKVFLSSEEAVEAGYPSSNQLSDYSFHILNWLPDNSVTGTYTHADGRVEKIEGGKTETQIKEEKEAAKRKAAEDKKAYEAKCRKYGKAYVDAAAEGKLKVGMHLDLVKEIYDPYLQRGREYSDGTAYYYVETMAGTIRVAVWLKNDRVTEFSLR